MSCCYRGGQLCLKTVQAQLQYQQPCTQVGHTRQAREAQSWDNAGHPIPDNDGSSLRCRPSRRAPASIFCPCFYNAPLGQTRLCALPLCKGEQATQGKWASAALFCPSYHARHELHASSEVSEAQWQLKKACSYSPRLGQLKTRQINNGNTKTHHQEGGTMRRTLDGLPLRLTIKTPRLASLKNTALMGYRCALTVRSLQPLREHVIKTLVA